jgi:hypothetical protein
MIRGYRERNVGARPVRKDERDLALERNRDVLPVVEQVATVFLTQVRVRLLGAGNHHVARDALLVSTRDREHFVDDAADVDLGGEGGLEKAGSYANHLEKMAFIHTAFQPETKRT